VSTAAFIATGVFRGGDRSRSPRCCSCTSDKPGVARLQRHGVTMGMAPVRGGGVMFGGSLRF
jgi:hypothetical protein